MYLWLSRFSLLAIMLLFIVACQQAKPLAENTTLVYFDATGHITPQATAHGTYRKLLKAQQSGFLVQNFFSDSHNKQTDPFIIEVEHDLQAIIPTSIDGTFTRWYDNGQKAETGHYQHGRKHGQFTEWDKQGNTLMVMTFVNDLPHGRATLWYHHGSKYIEGQYSYGAESGVWYIRHPTGQIKLIVLFSAGKIISAKDGDGKPLNLNQQNLLKVKHTKQQ